MEDSHFPHKDITTQEPHNTPLITQDGSFIYGLFDGHKEQSAAKYCAHFFPKLLNQKSWFQSTENFITQAFFTINKNYKNSFQEIPTSQSYCSLYHCLNFCCSCGQQKDQEDEARIPDDGATALITLITNKGTLYIANVGDSRAVLCDNNKHKRLSFDHKPNEDIEHSRLNAIASRLNQDPSTLITEITDQRTGQATLFDYNLLENVNPLTGVENVRQISIPNYKLLGEISICRAIGDFKFEPYITCEPFISCHSLIGTEQFLILGCDGFWDVINDQAATNLILYHLAGFKKIKPELFKSSHYHAELAEKLSTILVKKAFDLGSKDNITVTIILFPSALNIKALTTDYKDFSRDSINSAVASLETSPAENPLDAQRRTSPQLQIDFTTFGLPENFDLESEVFSPF
jgi:serine/threonine protein phosphatase PrpC